MINKLMKKYGYKLIRESKYGVVYKKEEPQGFTHCVSIDYKCSGKHLIQSYDTDVQYTNNDYWTKSCGLEIPIVLLMWLKSKYLMIRYHWKSVSKRDIRSE